MKRFIAPKVLTVSNQSSPCECEDGIVCAYWVQANLILWEREEHLEEKTKNRILEAMKKNGVRKSARLIGVSKDKINRWTRMGNILERYLQEAQKAICP